MENRVKLLRIKMLLNREQISVIIMGRHKKIGSGKGDLSASTLEMETQVARWAVILARHEITIGFTPIGKYLTINFII